MAEGEMNRRGKSNILSAVRMVAACAAEALEPRVLFTTVNEVEPNDIAADANVLSVSSTQLIVNGSMSGTDVDFFKFTIGQRSGVFIDVDSQETDPTSTLDSVLELYDGA